MSVRDKNQFLSYANRFHLHLYHFAKGTYPQADGTITALPVNRLLIPLGEGDRGRSYVSDKNYHFPMRSGSVYFIPAFHPAGVKLTEHMPFISVQFLLDFQNGVDLFSLSDRVLEIESPAAATLAETIFHTASEPVQAVRLQGFVYDFLGTILQELEVSGPDPDRAAGSADQELARLNETCSAATTVAELAEQSGLCRDTFSRTFIRKHGISPKQFLNRCVLRRAYTLLLTDPMKICEIARKLQFNNEFYFSRFFKKHTGMSPKEFRLKNFKP